MFSIIVRTINLTRGDTARIDVDITNTVTGEKYEIKADDTLTLTVRNVIDSPICFQKTVTGSKTIHIAPEDTAGMLMGRYVYDVEIKTASGDVYTVIPVSEFNILPEVTY